MKKAMIALAGIVSVMMLASCQKEVEIDGDVSKEKTAYEYYLDVTECTATEVDVVYDSETEKWNKAEGAAAYTLKANTASVSWNTNTNTNMTEYTLEIGYTGALKANERILSGWIKFVECNGKYYYHRVKNNYYEQWTPADFVPENELTVTGSPKEASFTIAGTWVSEWYSGSERGTQYSIDALKFTRK